METIAKARTQMVVFALLAFWALIAAVVLAIILIVKKEKRRQMKKTKIAAVVSALLVPIMSFISVTNWYASTLVIVESTWLPDLVGLPYEECKEAYSNHFELVVEEEQYSYEYPEGIIIEQKPAEGSEYNFDTTVYCKISKGLRIVTVPNVIELDSDDAKKTLEENGFTVILAIEDSDDISKGNVIATDPPKFERVVYGSTVKVTVSGGKEPEVTDDNK